MNDWFWGKRHKSLSWNIAIWGWYWIHHQWRLVPDYWLLFNLLHIWKIRKNSIWRWLLFTWFKEWFFLLRHLRDLFYKRIESWCRRWMVLFFRYILWFFWLFMKFCRFMNFDLFIIIFCTSIIRRDTNLQFSFFFFNADTWIIWSFFLSSRFLLCFRLRLN